jgi:SAM-dependent methyltransferase
LRARGGPADLLRIAGHEMSIYDPFYAPDTNLLKYKYDFITCSETVEHFHDPAREFIHFDNMLKAGGLLAIMTNFQTGDDAFVNWYYRRDPTHVVFYRRRTFEVLAAQHRWHHHFPVPNVAFLTKPSDTS